MSRVSFSATLPSLAGLGVSMLTLIQLAGLPTARAFDMNKNTNLAVYWGQNAYGGSHPHDTAKWQKPIDYYCHDDAVDLIPIAFLDHFNGTGGLPEFSVANSCSGPFFPGTRLLNCRFMESQIKACQKKGKAVTISLGGGTSSPDLHNDEAGKAFAHLIWDLFLGGKHDKRPFGNAVLDGIDMDIEGGHQTGFVAFLTTLRSLMGASHKKYYITAAPQCVFPDHWIGDTLDHFGFDAVFVQFYNNFCGLQNFSTSAWNFHEWDNWAKHKSPNKDVKVYIGAPAAKSAAGSGYVEASRLDAIIKETKSKYSSFGGVMLWDISEAWANNRFDKAIKNGLTHSGFDGDDQVASWTTPELCTNVSPWKSNVVYLGGDKAAYDGHLWTARWWSYNDLPTVDTWIDEGSCETSTTTSESVSLVAEVEEAVQSFFMNYFHFRTGAL